MFSNTTPRYSIEAPALYSEFSPSSNPSGTEFAFVSTRSGTPEIHLRDVRSGWERTLVRSADFEGATSSLADLAFSPDSRHLAFTRSDAAGGSIWIASINGERPVRIATGRSPVWTRDANVLVFRALHNGDLCLLRLRLGSTSAATPTLVRRTAATPLGYSKDGAWLLTLQPNGSLTVLSANGSRSRQIGDQSWVSACWWKNSSRILGLHRNNDRHL